MKTYENIELELDQCKIKNVALEKRLTHELKIKEEQGNIISALIEDKNTLKNAIKAAQVDYKIMKETMVEMHRSHNILLESKSLTDEEVWLRVVIPALKNNLHNLAVEEADNVLIEFKERFRNE